MTSTECSGTCQHCFSYQSADIWYLSVSNHLSPGPTLGTGAFGWTIAAVVASRLLNVESELWNSSTAGLSVYWLTVVARGVVRSMVSQSVCAIHNQQTRKLVLAPMFALHTMRQMSSFHLYRWNQFKDIPWLARGDNTMGLAVIDWLAVVGSSTSSSINQLGSVWYVNW